jgi:hypothetical protein
LNELGLHHKLDAINKNIAVNQPKAISQSFDNYYIMKNKLGLQNKLIWALSLNWNDPSTHTRIENLLQKDKTIKACLVNYTTGEWR